MPSCVWRMASCRRKRVRAADATAGISGLVPQAAGANHDPSAGREVADDLVERQFRPSRRTCCGSPTSPTCAAGRAGSISPPCRTPTPGDRGLVDDRAHAHRARHRRAPAWPSHRRRPDPGLVHHSDQGSQYVSLGFGQQARDAGIAISMGSRGDAYDNAVAESFFATLKKELVHRQSWPTQARTQLRRLRVHRSVLQPPATTLHARHALTNRLQSSYTLRKQTAPLPRTSSQKCRLKRGSPAQDGGRGGSARSCAFAQMRAPR